MKTLTLTLALFGLVSALPAQAEVDPSDWTRLELLWNEEYDTYVLAPVLGEDPFQEKLVWSDRLGDYIPPLMARAEAQPAYQEELVWVDEYDAYFSRPVLNPCSSEKVTFARPQTTAMND